MIQFDHVSKNFRSTPVLHDVSFEVPAGSVTGFLGPNGAGKTTAMRILLGHSRATSGEARVLGAPYRGLPNPAYLVGGLLDANAVHPGRSGRETLAIAAGMLGVSSDRVTEVLGLVGLTRAESRRTTRGYSLGMLQRLGIANALLGRPRALVLDEPTNGLDPQGIHWLRQLVRGIADDGCAVLLSSHHLQEVAHVADRIVIIGAGRILQDDTVDSYGGYADLERRYFDLTATTDRTAA
jgi:ABC-2 type transport system ATP-binding protein